MTGFQSVKVGEVQLSFEERGSGIPVILVHGIPTDYRAWSNQLAAFSGDFRTISISRRHAYPNKNDGLKVTDSTVTANSDDLISFIHTLGLEKLHLIGHSYGGFIALYTAWKHPELFRSLVLVEPAVPSMLVKNEKSPLQVLSFLLSNYSAATSARRFQTSNLKLALRSFEDGNYDAAARYFYEGIREVPGSFDRLPSEMRSMMLQNGVTVGELETEFPIFTKKDAETVKLPVILVKAQNSPAWLRAIADRLERSLPSSLSTREISNSCHFPHVENPAEFNPAVLGFLKRNSQ
jgi:pimeloyl-ACP methyl ester carboxylesterase